MIWKVKFSFSISTKFDLSNHKRQWKKLAADLQTQVYVKWSKSMMKLAQVALKCTVVSVDNKFCFGHWKGKHFDGYFWRLWGIYTWIMQKNLCVFFLFFVFSSCATPYTHFAWFLDRKVFKYWVCAPILNFDQNVLRSYILHKLNMVFIVPWYWVIISVKPSTLLNEI